MALDTRLVLLRRLVGATHRSVPDSVRLPAELEACAMLADPNAADMILDAADDLLRAGNPLLLAAARPHFPAVAALRDASRATDGYGTEICRGTGSSGWYGAAPNVDAAALWCAATTQRIATLWDAFAYLSLNVESSVLLPHAQAMMAASLASYAGLTRDVPQEVSSKLRRFMAWRVSGTAVPDTARWLGPLDTALAALPADEWAYVWTRERRIFGVPALLRFAGHKAAADCILAGGGFAHAKKHGLDLQAPASLHQLFPVLGTLPSLDAFESLPEHGRTDAVRAAFASLQKPLPDGSKPVKVRRSPNDAFSPEAEAKRAARAQKRRDDEAKRLLEGAGTPSDAAT